MENTGDDEMSEGTQEREEAYRLCGHITVELKTVWDFIHSQVSRAEKAEAQLELERRMHERTTEHWLNGKKELADAKLTIARIDDERRN